MGGWLLWVWSVWKGCFVYSVQFFLCDGGAVAKGNHSSMRTPKSFVASRDLIKINVWNTSFEWSLFSFLETSQGCCLLSVPATVNMYWYEAFDPSQNPSLTASFLWQTATNTAECDRPGLLCIIITERSRVTLWSILDLLSLQLNWRHCGTKNCVGEFNICNTC